MRAIISRFIIAATAGAALQLSACGQPSDPRPATPTPPTPAEVRHEGPLIAVLGDSLAAGYGLPESQAFPAVVGELLREKGHAVRILNAGVSGDTTAGGLSRIDWILSQQPDILVVELGGNDALRGQPLEHSERNLRQIIRRGVGAGAAVVLLGMDVPANYGPDYTETFAAMYPRLAEEEGVALVPGFVRGLADDSALIGPDGLHPTAAGQRFLAETLAPHLEKTLESISTDSRGQ